MLVCHILLFVILHLPLAKILIPSLHLILLSSLPDFFFFFFLTKFSFYTLFHYLRDHIIIHLTVRISIINLLGCHSLSLAYSLLYFIPVPNSWSALTSYNHWVVILFLWRILQCYISSLYQVHHLPWHPQVSRLPFCPCGSQFNGLIHTFIDPRKLLHRTHYVYLRRLWYLYAEMKRCKASGNIHNEILYYISHIVPPWS